MPVVQRSTDLIRRPAASGLTLPAGHRRDHVDHRAGRHGGVEAVERAALVLVDEDVHVAPDRPLLVLNPALDGGGHASERIKDLAKARRRPHLERQLAAAAGVLRERLRAVGRSRFPARRRPPREWPLPCQGLIRTDSTSGRPDTTSVKLAPPSRLAKTRPLRVPKAMAASPSCAITCAASRITDA